PVRLLARVARRADIDIERAAAIERQALVFVLPLIGQAHHDRLRPACGLELTVRHLVALDDGGVRDIQVAVAQTDPRRAAGADLLARLELAVAVGVMQRDHAAAGLRLAAAAAALRGDEDIAVLRDGDVTRGADVVGDDERAET